MKHILITTIAALLVVGCGNPEADRALLDASEKENIEVVKQHLDAGADVNAKDEGGQTPLHRAALRGHKEIVELLIANGADRNAKDLNGRTPLHYATFGYNETVELLLASGTDVNPKDRGGQTPLDLAIQQKKPETAALLRKHEGKSGANDSIHIAASVGNIEAVKQHLAIGSDVNVKNKFGLTPMHKAARFGQKEVVELLIAKGADVNAKNDDGVTPLDTAIVGFAFVAQGKVTMHKHPELADLLRKHGGKTGEELKAESK
jgi:ankyrin repeat protein